MSLLLASLLAVSDLTPGPYAAWYNYQQDYLRKNANRPGWRVTASGLQYRRLSKEATGRQPLSTDIVKVHYVGTDSTGKVFDSSIARGEPATFPLNEVIQGWTEGVQLMRVGEKWEFLIPAALAYGDKGAGAEIPPGSTLRFTIELLEIQDSPQ